jgi:hypothetical protein
MFKTKIEWKYKKYTPSIHDKKQTNIPFLSLTCKSKVFIKTPMFTLFKYVQPWELPLVLIQAKITGELHHKLLETNKGDYCRFNPNKVYGSGYWQI